MAGAKGKTRKHGRQKAKCESYRRAGTREKNAALRQKRHLKRLAFFAKRALLMSPPVKKIAPGAYEISA